MFSTKSKSRLNVLPLLLLRVAFTVALALVFTGVVGTHSEAATRLPDLIVSAVSAPSTAQPGQSFVLSASIKNQGRASASNAQAAFYLTNSASSITGATLLGTQNVGSLSAEVSLALTTTLSIPSSTSPGTFYVVAVADPSNATRESNETNNTRASAAIAVKDSTPPTISFVNATRPFLMGFNPWPREFAEQAIKDAYWLTSLFGDIYAVHFEECVPWEEAYNNGLEVYGTEYFDNLKGIRFINEVIPLHLKQLKLYPGKKIFLELMAHDRTQGLQPSCAGSGGDWANKSFNDPKVITAYKNWVRYMINKFNPNYVNYGIESTEIIYNNLNNAQKPTLQDDYLALAKDVYNSMKREFPNIPFMMSVTIGGSTESFQTKRKPVIEKLLQYSDFVAVSIHPFLDWQIGPNGIPIDLFKRVTELAPTKPFAIAETGFTAKEVIVGGGLPNIPGNENWQFEYVRFMLTQAASLNAEFVIWFTPTDYEKLWEYEKSKNFPAMHGWWKNAGLIGDKEPLFAPENTAANFTRPALIFWYQVYNFPIQRGSL